MGSRPKVAVLYNAPTLPSDHPDAISEADVVEVAQAVSAILEGDGFETWPFAVGPPVAELAGLLSSGTSRVPKPDVVFNLIEGFGGSSVAATYATALIALSRVPCTGSPPEALAYCLEKGRAKALLRGFGLPTARSVVVPPGQSVGEWDWPGPVIVKPDAEDGSLGIDQGSVVTGREAASRRIARIHEAYGGPALLEAYLPGPEFNVGVVGLPALEPLPIAEILFTPGPGAWPILTYDAKWAVGSAEDLASVVRCPAEIGGDLAGRLGRLAVAAAEATACRDYARVDLRLDDRGEPMILEVNPNPDIGPTAGWARALRASGRDYAGTIAAIARQAWERGKAVEVG